MCGHYESDEEKVETALYRILIDSFKALKIETQQRLLDHLSRIWLESKDEYVKKREEALRVRELALSEKEIKARTSSEGVNPPLRNKY